MTVIHKQSCVDAFARFNEMVEHWEREWPNCCKSCGGQGSISQPGDWVPYGSTSAQLPDTLEPCSGCTEVGLCGRCGADNDSEESGPLDGYVYCIKCSWTDNLDEQTRDMTHPRIHFHPTGEGPCECELDEEKYRQIAHDSFGDLLDRHL